MNRYLLAIMMVLSVGFVHAIPNSQHVVWDKTPINIPLTIGSERTIIFPGTVKILHEEMSEDKLAIVEKADNVIYIKSLQRFDSQSFFVLLSNSNERIKLNFSSNENGNNKRPIEIEVNNTQNNVSDVRDPSEANPISLTRYAIQTLFSPNRLTSAPFSVGRVPMETQKTIHMIYGGETIEHPLLSYGSNGLVVTAIEVRNILSRDVELDPRNIVGAWETATFYPSNSLSPRGTSNDKTTLFVTSYSSFGTSLNNTRGVLR